VGSLEAALWAFARGGSFREGALLAVNLGDDADTTGAVYGQLAGAHYGVEGIPEEWRGKLALRATDRGVRGRAVRRGAGVSLMAPKLVVGCGCSCLLTACAIGLAVAAVLAGVLL
jgi:hypothetical protein